MRIARCICAGSALLIGCGDEQLADEAQTTEAAQSLPGTSGKYHSERCDPSGHGGYGRGHRRAKGWGARRDADPTCTIADGGVEGGGQVDGGTPDSGSSDGGGSTCGWEDFAQGLSGGAIADVLLDARGGSTAYLAAAANVLYRSDDRGRSFVVQGRLQRGAFATLLQNGPEPSRLLAGTTAGLAASNDRGATWDLIALDGLPLSALGGSASQPLQLYAASQGAGILSSHDGGSTWTGPGAGLPFAVFTGITVDPNDARRVVASGVLLNEFNAPGQGVVVRSDNGGTTWDVVLSSADWVADVARCFQTPEVLVAPVDGTLARSTDNGVSWSVLEPASRPIAANAAFGPRSCDDLYLLEFAGKLWRSRDGWTSREEADLQGLNVAPVGTLPGSLRIDPNDPSRLVVGTHNGVYVSADQGDSWTLSAGIDQLRLTLRGDSDGDVWAAGWGAGVWKRESSAPSWARVPVDALPTDYVHVVVPDPYSLDRVLVGVPGQGVYIGQSETFGFSSLGVNPLDFAFDPRDTDTLYAATQVAGVFKSSDAGASWTPMNQGLQPFETPNGVFIDVRFVQMDQNNPDTLFIGTYGSGVWRSNDGANSWHRVFGAGKRVSCLSLRGEIVVACADGVFVSADGGETFVDQTDGLPTLDVTGLAVTAESDLIATTNHGVFVRRGSAGWIPLDPQCVGPSSSSPVIVAAQGQQKLVVATAGGAQSHAL